MTLNSEQFWEYRKYMKFTSVKNFFLFLAAFAERHKSVFGTRYRVVRWKRYFCAEFKLWWFPFWLECSSSGFWGVNVCSTPEEAEQTAKEHAARRAAGKPNRLVKDLGVL